MCGAAALSASEALTWGRPRRSPTAWAAGAGGRRQRARGPLPSRPLPAPLGHATVLWFSPLSAVRPTPAGGEACVRTRCWGPRRASARFCFRGSRTMPLWPATGVCGASGMLSVASGGGGASPHRKSLPSAASPGQDFVGSAVGCGVVASSP
jgi:hypothetical protein